MRKNLSIALTLLALIGVTPLLSACEHRGGDDRGDREHHDDRGGQSGGDHRDDHPR